MSYPFQKIEKKWQEFWEKNKIFKTKINLDKPKYYVLDMFPYPSGAGLHVGHPEGYTATDIIARYKRMCGFNVLHPMGWDAFGLPAERYASTTGIHPATTTKTNIANFKRQLQALGFSYDWDREINTTDENYYKWTQWIFLKIFNSFYDEKKNQARPIQELEIPKKYLKNEKSKNEFINSKRLAYLKKAPVNFCPELGTILANEEAEEWTSKGYTVERKNMRQWFLRITAYSKRLVEDLQFVDWPLGTLLLQKNWIGESKGALILFPLADTTASFFIEVFTTRPDTIFGVTYLVLAPEHPLVPTLIEKQKTLTLKQKLEEYVLHTSRVSEVERMIQNKDKKKTGVFTGFDCIHPLTQEKIPIWIADYVLMGYGTGAVMAVPSDDSRDLEFAQTFDLPLKKVYTDEGICIHSDFLNDLNKDQAILKIIKELEKRKIGRRHVQYKLRDWLFSRQRYWGEPIPISHDKEGRYHTLSEEGLPLILPEVQDFQPTQSGESPLARIPDWLHQKIKMKTENKKEKEIEVRRETNTMPQWAGSCWYYLRFISPDCNTRFVDTEAEKYWMSSGGVDLYIGGAEHAVLHLLYARFWHKFLYDLGLVSSKEPFQKLVHQGIILGEDGQKMSKSRGNVVNPDQVVTEYGADSLRLFEMFLGPLEKSKPWSAKGIEGVSRFLSKVWRFYISTDSLNDSSKGPILDQKLLTEPTGEKKEGVERILNITIKKVTQDLDQLSFNTAISNLMIFINEISAMFPKEERGIGKKAAETFLLLLSPFAPHISEELWFLLGNKKSLAFESWPSFDISKTVFKMVEVVFQVNSKVRSKIKIELGLPKEKLEALAIQDENVRRFTEGKNIKRILVVPDKIVNIVCD